MRSTIVPNFTGLMSAGAFGNIHVYMRRPRHFRLRSEVEKSQSTADWAEEAVEEKIDSWLDVLVFDRHCKLQCCCFREVRTLQAPAMPWVRVVAEV
ncbi:hypothetical protein EJ03DRAFT_328633, partial [Teratosphaeria nubilosa]